MDNYSFTHLCFDVIYLTSLLLLMSNVKAQINSSTHSNLTSLNFTLHLNFTSSAQLNFTSTTNLTSSITLPLFHRDDPSSPVMVFNEEEEFAEDGTVNVTRMVRKDERRVYGISRRVALAVMMVGREYDAKSSVNASGVAGNANASVTDNHVASGGAGNANATDSPGDTHEDSSGSPGGTIVNVNESTPVTTGYPDGEFFTVMGIGYRDFLLVIDTGSDLMWVQCLPCFNCYTQEDPIFNPTDSSTFEPVTCASGFCAQPDIMACREQICQYQQFYGDGSFTVGSMVRDNIYIDNFLLQADVLMGCGHDNQGLFTGAAGLLGLSRGPLSLISQISAHTGGVFSYCLSSTGPGTLSFGPLNQVNAENPNLVYVPLLRNPLPDLTYYYVPLVGISIQGVMVLGIRPLDLLLRPSGHGGVIIDSGTTITRLIAPVYYAMRDAFREVASMRGYRFPMVYSIFDTCYVRPRQGPVGALPSIELHFEGGSQISLPIENIMYLIPADVPLLCLAFAPSSTALSILGNILQQGFLITYDTQASRLGFLSNQCPAPPSLPSMNP